jgi:F0F1-type ATP synthase membrane subunit b/b'
VGWIIIQNGEAKIKDLKMDLLGGSITLDGSYSTPEETRANVRMALKVNGFDVQQSYNALPLVKTFAPVAERTRGSYSAVFSFHSELNDQLRPILSSMLGSGNLSSSKVVIEDIQVFNQIADMLKIDRLTNATIDALNLSFEILDGKVLVRQFPFQMGSIGALLSGYTSLDQQISFILALEIPRTEFGTHFNDVVDQLAGKINKTGADLQIGDKVRVDVIIGGTVTKPTVTIGLKEAMENVVDELKSKVEEELQKKKEEAEALMKEEAEKYIAKIDAEARQLILEAEKQAEEIKALARQSAQKIRQESDSTAVKLIEEGKKNGKLAEMAATAAAGQLKKEAGSKASLLVTEADQRADAIISEARKKADQMKQEAREKFNLSN